MSVYQFNSNFITLIKLMAEENSQEQIINTAEAAVEEQKNGAEEALQQPMQPEGESEYVKTTPFPGGFFNESDGNASVKVAVRVRPLVARELRTGSSKSIVETEPEKIRMGGKEFVFDQVFDMDSRQDDVFHMCSYNQVLGCFDGYNATILAYGQTGSGKTHSMGTGSTIGMPPEQIGIVPRVFEFIFEELENRRRQSAFSKFAVKVQFLELYNEELHDLLDMQIDKATGQSSKQLAIREERDGSITIQGLKAEEVNNKKECVDLLNKGIASRVTASTNMNEQSSRSHAIFTITIEQKIIKVMDGGEKDENGDPVTSEENISAKFHFVDLAGSERIKKTGASGKTLQEGININKGLLALGNVISALTDTKKIESGKAFVPYRDSKLTRILQDSLGGNSKTTMLACVSPADQNHEETLGTIKYASRARNIKNKPVVNRDANSMLIEALRNQITGLQAEVTEYQTILKENNVPVPEDMKSRIEASTQQQNEKKQQQPASAPAASASLVLPTSGGGSNAAQSGSLMQELRELKIKYARTCKELKESQNTITQMNTKGSENKTGLEALQNERDQLVIRNEALNEILQKNNITEPKEAATSNIASAGGKRTQTLIDEYKVKVQKFTAEIEAKNKELLAKSKKITEIQSQMKRDEAVLKKYSAENSKMKLEAKRNMTAKTAVAPPVQKKKGSADTEDISNKLMDKLTSQIQNIFAGDEDSDGHEDQEQEQETNEVKEVKVDEPEGLQVEMTQSVQEVRNVLNTQEGQEQVMKAVKEKYMLIQKDLEDVIQNKWEQKIQQLQTEKARVEKERSKQMKLDMDSAQAKELEKKYKSQMDDLNKKLAKEEQEKKKKEVSLAKSMQQQEARIKTLETEVEKQKKQRDDEMYRRKYGEERFANFKVSASKDMQKEKKNVEEKTKNINKLKTDLKKADEKVQKKIAELRGLQKKAREDHEQRIKEEEREHDKQGIDVDVIKDWIQLNTDQMIKNKELSEYLKENEKQKEELEDEMLECGDRLGEIELQKDRLAVEQETIREMEEEGDEVDEARLLELESEIEDLEMESNSIVDTLDNLQEHLDFLVNKINEITTEINSYDMNNINPPRFKGLKNVDVARATLQTFFLVMLDLNVYKKELETKCIEQDEKIIVMQNTINIMKHENPESMSYAEKQAQLRKQAQMNKVLLQIGDGSDFIDNRDTENMDLTNEEQSNLTKMSLSKIVSNLRNKLKDEGKKNEKLNHKLDQLIKEKDQLKQKYKELETQQKRGGAPIKFSMSGVSQTRAASNSSEKKPVSSRINTGRAAPSQTMTKPKVEKQQSPEKRLSFKDRRDMMKAKQDQSREQKSSVSSYNSRQKPDNSRQKTGAQTALDRKRDQLKQEKQASYQTEVAQIAGVMSTQMPEMIVEDENDEYQEEEELLKTKKIQIGTEEIDEDKIRQLENALDMDMSMVTNATEEIDETDTDIGGEHSWKLTPLSEVKINEGVCIVDIDQVGDRVFALYDDMTLIEISIKSKSVTRTSNLCEIEETKELQGKKAIAFSVFEDAGMCAVVIDTKVLFFDYDSGEPSLVKTLEEADVKYVTFVECQIILCIEPEDSDDITLRSYDIDGDEPAGEITIKRFLQNKIMLRAGFNAVYFTAGKQIGRISVPEMQLEYQEDSGHAQNILDFQVTDTSIYTTASDEELRVFDCESGMQIIAPVEEMECDTLAANGQYILTRCGGEVIMIWRFVEGEEELEEVDMIELKDTLDQEYTATYFKMRGGNLKATLADEKEYQIVLLAEQKESSLAIKLLSHGAH